MRNQMLLTLDSMRYDVFEKANLPFMKSQVWDKAFTHACFTLPAHMAFFAGKLPCNFKNGPFDNLARVNRNPKAIQQWRLMNPESVQPCEFKLQGKNIVDGFNKIGFNTIGTGAVSWFNTTKPAHIPTVDDFKQYKWFGEYTVAQQQTAWVREQMNKSDKYFAFINFGETHHPFKALPRDPEVRYGSTRACMMAQQRCVEYLDNQIANMLKGVKGVDVFICGDHGECLGEDGLWGHQAFHQKVIEVPIVKLAL